MYQYKITLLKNKIAEEEVKFTCSKDVAENSFIRHLFTDQDNDKEKLYVIILNIKNKVIGYSLVSMRSLTSSIVHPREVLKPAILASAASIIIIHNHPSGDPEPSSDDIEVTNRISRACSIMGINLLDHIILSFEAEEFKGYYSFRQKDII
ncbi:MAG: JAB domain-containing protein [Actinobacteria bacterium]|nr:JAB domain-containing protein [Actinomycetota bacterium]